MGAKVPFCFNWVLSTFLNFKTWWQLSSPPLILFFSKVLLVVNIKNKQAKFETKLLKLGWRWGLFQRHRYILRTWRRSSWVSEWTRKLSRASLHICLFLLHFASGWSLHFMCTWPNMATIQLTSLLFLCSRDHLRSKLTSWSPFPTPRERIGFVLLGHESNCVLWPRDKESGLHNINSFWTTLLYQAVVEEQGDRGLGRHTKESYYIPKQKCHPPHHFSQSEPEVDRGHQWIEVEKGLSRCHWPQIMMRNFHIRERIMIQKQVEN